MALTEIAQLKTQLEQSKHILLVFSLTDTIDGVGSALAFKAWLEKQSKQVDVAATNFTAPKNLRFLRGIDHIAGSLSHLQKFIIKVDVSKAEIDTLSYDIKDKWLSIYLTPKTGTLTRTDLRTAQSVFKYDLVIVLNAPDFESIGEIFFNNTDLFYRSPVCVIDHHASNERYGQINLIDITATSTTEIVFETIKQINEAYMDAEIATMLLTGMVAATKSFKSPQVSPKTLSSASELIHRGAEREKIIQHLFRTKSLPTLKLWGEALTHLKNDPTIGLVWAPITRESFLRSGANIEDVHGLIDELISNSPEAKVIVLLAELEKEHGRERIKVWVSSEKGSSAVEITKPFHSQGDKKQAHFIMEGKNLKQVEEEVTRTLKEMLENRTK